MSIWHYELGLSDARHTVDLVRWSKPAGSRWCPSTTTVKECRSTSAPRPAPRSATRWLRRATRQRAIAQGNRNQIGRCQRLISEFHRFRWSDYNGRRVATKRRLMPLPVRARARDGSASRDAGVRTNGRFCVVEALHCTSAFDSHGPMTRGRPSREETGCSPAANTRTL
jgi:hypothetical protein